MARSGDYRDVKGRKATSRGIVESIRKSFGNQTMSLCVGMLIPFGDPERFAVLSPVYVLEIEHNKTGRGGYFCLAPAGASAEVFNTIGSKTNTGRTPRSLQDLTSPSYVLASISSP